MTEKAESHSGRVAVRVAPGHTVAELDPNHKPITIPGVLHQPPRTIHRHRTRKQGEIVHLEAAEAEALLRRGVVLRVDEPVSQPPTEPGARTYKETSRIDGESEAVYAERMRGMVIAAGADEEQTQRQDGEGDLDYAARMAALATRLGKR